MDTPNHTTDQSLKRCSKGYNCADLNGPWLPATTEYFAKRSSSKDGFESYCKECERRRQGRQRRANKFPPAPEGFKYCGTCKDPKPLDEFHKNKNGTGGRAASCKECAKARANKWHWDNHDEHLASMKQFREDNPELFRERSRQYRRDHPDYAREKNRRFREEHPEEYKARKKRDYEKHSDKYIRRVKNWKKTTKGKASVRAAASRRHARQHQAEGFFTSEDLVAQYKRQKGKCYWCEKPMDPNDYEADHVIPLVRGGDNWPTNIVCAHPSCNSSKGGKLPHEWQGNGGKLL